MKPIPTLIAAAVILASIAPAFSQVLIDGPLLNGDFEANPSGGADSVKFTDTPFWVSLNSQGTEATRTNIAPTRSAVVSEGRVASLNYHAIDTLYDLAAEDKVSVVYDWRDAFNWNDASDQVAVELFTTDDDQVTGIRTIFETLLSGTSVANNAYQEYAGTSAIIDGALVGKRLFAAFRGEDGNANANGFGRVDNFKLAIISDPQLGKVSGDFAFGDLFHGDGTSSTTRTVSYTNAGSTQNLTIDDILWNDDAGVFSLTSLPTLPLVLAPGETFDIEITATGGGGNVDFVGELLIDTTPDRQDTKVAVTATITSTGDPFLITSNPDMESGLGGWSGNAAPTDGLGSTGGARISGRGDNRNDTSVVFTSNFGQAFNPKAFGNFDLEFSIAIPDFSIFTGEDPVAEDRSFNLLIMTDGGLLGTNPFTEETAANALINLCYLPGGTDGDTNAGFFVYDSVGSSFQRLADLGTLTESTDFNVDRSPPNTLNIHKIRIEGRDFGTPSASYSIQVTDANSPAFSRTATNLTANRGADITTNLAGSLVFTTNDQSSTNPGASYQPTFWLDDVQATLGNASLPVTFFEAEVATGAPKFIPGMSKTLFTVSPSGAGGNLDISGISFGDPGLSLVSPALPVSIPPGTSQAFVVKAGESTPPGLISDTVTLTTNDSDRADQAVDIKLRVFSSSSVTIVDYDDGIANGVHEASVRNGGFEEGADGDSVDLTPAWTSKTSSGLSSDQLTFSTQPATGSLHGRTAGWSGGTSRIPVHDLQTDDWTLEEGDYFTVEFKWKADANFDTVGDTLNCVMFGLNPNGAVVNDVSTRPIQMPITTDQTTSYNTVAFDNTPLGPDAVVLGLGFRFLLEVARDGSHEALIDDVTLIGHFQSSPGSQATAISFISYDPETKTVALRWSDQGGAYGIEASNDLNFVSPTTIPLDGSETVTDGEYEFQFNDPGATGPQRFWRVAD